MNPAPGAEHRVAAQLAGWLDAVTTLGTRLPRASATHCPLQLAPSALRCPGDMRQVQGPCYERPPNPQATWLDAV